MLTNGQIVNLLGMLVNQIHKEIVEMKLTQYEKDVIVDIVNTADSLLRNLHEQMMYDEELTRLEN